MHGVVPKSGNNESGLFAFGQIDSPPGTQECMSGNHDVHRMSKSMVLLPYDRIIDPLRFAEITFSEILEKGT